MGDTVIKTAYGGAIQVLSHDESGPGPVSRGFSGKGCAVPMTATTGGVKDKKQSPFGRIVHGHLKIGEEHEDGGPDKQSLLVLGDCAELVDRVTGEPVLGPDVPAPTGKKPAKSRRKKKEVEEEVEGPDEVEVQARKELYSERLDNLLEGMLAELPEPPVSAPARTIPDEKIRYTLSGAFGTYRGRALSLSVEGPLLVLMLDEESDIYTPPASREDVLTLDTGEKRYTLLFVGIEFPLRTLGLFTQVFFLAEEDAEK